MLEESKSPQYALVAYVPGALGEFVETLRAELHPRQAHLKAHITVLPPRTLHGDERAAVAHLRAVAKRFPAFDAALGEVGSFAPATPTVFINVERGAQTLREMHSAFNAGSLGCEEPWPFVPHLTIAKMPEFAGAERALQLSRERWMHYSSRRAATIAELTFVREAGNNRWIDLEVIPLQEG